MRLISRFVAFLLTPILVFAQLPAQTAAPEALQLRVVQGENTSFIIEVTDASGAAVSDAAIVLRLPDTEPTGTFRDGTRAAIAYSDRTGRAAVRGIRWGSTSGVVAIRATATKGTAHAGILIQETLAPVSAGVLAHAASQTTSSALPPAIVSLPSPPPLATAPMAPGQPALTAPSLASSRPPATLEPAVSVTSASPGESKHSTKTKWIILAAVAAAAGGAGVAMMGKKSSSPGSTGGGISIGPPSVSVGHP